MLNQQEARNPPERPTKAQRALARIMERFETLECDKTERDER